MKKKITKNLEVRGYENIDGKRYARITDIHGVTVGFIEYSYDNKLGFTGTDIIEGMTEGKSKTSYVPFND